MPPPAVTLEITQNLAGGTDNTGAGTRLYGDADGVAGCSSAGCICRSATAIAGGAPQTIGALALYRAPVLRQSAI